jgi:hypothetical protein
MSFKSSCIIRLVVIVVMHDGVWRQWSDSVVVHLKVPSEPL